MDRVDINFEVYVKCITFNHAPYIVDAMDGFCMQNADFPYVCVVMDDASTDGEQDVIRNYLQDNFDLEDTNIVRNEETEDYILIFARHKTNHNCYFAVYLLKYNHHSISKSKDPYLKEWEGNCKYIALCEGDDYWTDHDKLQRQVDYLQRTNSCKLCFCKVIRYNQSNNRYNGFWGGNVKTLDDALVSENVIPTLTICFTKDEYMHFLEEFNPSQYHWHLGDLPLFLWFAHFGGLHFIDESVGVYRELEESASHSKNSHKSEVFLTDVMNIKLLFDERFNNSKRALDINDIFMRKFMALYGISFRSFRRTYLSFIKIRNKTIKDYYFLVRYAVYSWFCL